MNFQEERKLVEKLNQDDSQVVFWKREMPVLKNDVITTEKVWTFQTGYLIENKLYELGTDRFLCELWIDEEYLDEVSNGKNIVIID